MSQSMSNEIQNIHYCTYSHPDSGIFFWKAGFPLSGRSAFTD